MSANPDHTNPPASPDRVTDWDESAEQAKLIGDHGVAVWYRDGSPGAKITIRGAGGDMAETAIMLAHVIVGIDQAITAAAAAGGCPLHVLREAIAIGVDAITESAEFTSRVMPAQSKPGDQG